MIEHKAPEKWPYVDYCLAQKPRIFLAGSIEMGVAEYWQDKVVRLLSDRDVVFLNPRRESWDSTWEQSIDNPKFFEQVDWELDSLEKASHILMYFDPSTKSPISLLELGLFARSYKLLVICPEGFWRKGNVDVVCKRYGISQLNSLDEFIENFDDIIEP